MRWWRRVLRRSQIEQELDAELRDHVERQIVDYVTRGISEPEARRRVRMDFGGLEQVKEMCRDVDRTRWLDTLVQDIRYGVRVFRRNPSFTLAAVLSLALGIGANTAIFTLVNATMLKPLPITQPERLLELLTNLGTGTPGNAFSYQALRYFRDHAKTLDIIASHDSRFFVATDDNGPELANGQYVTGDFFQILGVSPASGRTIESSDDRADAPLVVVLSHRYWQTRFQGNDSLIGDTMRINDRVVSIIGIAPASFRGLRPAIEVDVWVPLASEPLLRTPSNMTSASYNWLQIVGRARAGSSLDQARAELSALYYPAVIESKLATAANAADRAMFTRWRPIIESASTGLSIDRQQYGQPLIVLLAISSVVLLIACVNVANLLLARSATRQHEIAVRLSLGAKNARVVRQLLTESLFLALLGAAIGILIAYAACDYLLTVFATTRLPITLDVRPDIRVLSFTATLALVTALIFGMAPAWQTLSRVSPASLLRGGRPGHNCREPGTLTRMLVIGQVALSVIMLFCGGLFLRSLDNLRSLDKGFHSTPVLVLSSDVIRGEVTPEAQRIMFREAISRLGVIPGIRSASGSAVTPIWGGGADGRVAFEDGGSGEGREAEVSINWVSPGYFATLGTPLLAGRDFTWRDTPANAGVALVNRTLARRYLGSDAVIGQRLTLRGDRFEIVGVVGDAKYSSLRQEAPPTLYLHWIQQADAMLTGRNIRQFTVRTDGSPLAVAAAAREAIHDVAPAMTITKVWTLEQQVEASIVRDRLLGLLSGSFAGLGLLLAAIGLYGVMAYMVARRTSEIGIRMAMGAEAGQIAGMVVREALVVMVLGIAMGIIAALGFSQALATLLFQLKPNDPGTIVAVITLMVMTSLAAAYIPSRRAAHIQPTLALRAE